MLRYFVLSAAIVFGCAVLATAWVNRDLIRIKIASVYARVPPKPGSANARTAAQTQPLHGNAPWALSALPECLTQLSESTGPLAYVRRHIPPGAVRVVPPASLSYGDCTIALRGDAAIVRRGADELRIPPRVRLFRAGKLLVMLRQTRRGNDLRVYQSVR